MAFHEMQPQIDDESEQCTHCAEITQGSAPVCYECGVAFCKSCNPRQYYCPGGNHYFSELCCKKCIPKYGRFVDGDTYYCPCCAPPSEQLEHQFKAQAYACEESILRRDGRGMSINPDYLNDPTNWKRYETDPDGIEEEWEQLVVYRFDDSLVSGVSNPEPAECTDGDGWPPFDGDF